MVTMAHDGDAYNARQVISYFEEHREFIRKSYKQEIHGRIRVTISFGNFYTYGFPTGPIKADELSKELSKSATTKKWEKEAHVWNKGHTSADCRLQNSKQGLRPANENVSIRRPDLPNPHNSNISEGVSSRQFDGDSARRNSVPKENRYSGKISMKQNQSIACSISKEYIAEEMCKSSLVPNLAATRHSTNVQDTTLDDTSVGLTNSPPPQHLPNAQEVESRAVSDHRGSINSGGAKQNRRGYTSFLPTDNIDLGRLREYLKQHDFVETENLREYQATANRDISHGDIVLDDTFALKRFRLQDIKWYIFNLTRGVRGWETQRSDIRIQVRSRPLITAEELEERKGCQDLLENSGRLLHRNEKG